MRRSYRFALLACVGAVVEGGIWACGPIGSSPSDAPSSSSSSSSGASSSSASSGGPANVVVDPSKTYQTIDGFGGANTWQPGGPLSAAAAKLFFDPDSGIGLSLLRVGIDVTGTPLGYNVYSDITLAASYGARVWGAPWSPPAADKDNGSVIDGGDLCAAADSGTCTGDAYDAWSTTLAQFAATVYSKTGVALYGVSAQNEPDYTASYASCRYTPDQMVAFLNVLGPKLRALNPPVKLIAPEPDRWSHLWAAPNYGNAILNDPTASMLVDVLATHDYGFSPVPPPANVNIPIWETEVAGIGGNGPVITGPSVTIDNGIVVAQWIYNALTNGGASGWHYWWLVSQNSDDNEGLIFQSGQGPGDAGDVNTPPKRLYTLGNFSKFVRPGYKRIDVSGAEPANVEIAAFQDPMTLTTAIVAINGETKDIPLSLAIAGSSGSTPFTPWVTSATYDLAMQPMVTVAGGAFTATLPAQSVTTFVGQP
jgi:glucuronoarabinoxylan endo-1,4-beta-xylanase